MKIKHLGISLQAHSYTICVEQFSNFIGCWMVANIFEKEYTLKVSHFSRCSARLRAIYCHSGGSVGQSILRAKFKRKYKI